MNLHDYFLQPSWWPMLLLGPLMWFLMGRWDQLRAQRLALRIGPRTADLVPGLDPKLRQARRHLATAGFIFSALALMQPTWGRANSELANKGIDLVVCLDVSRSMSARDLQPSRLKRAKMDLKALADSLTGDRIGLIIFAGEAKLVSPLTRDANAFLTLLEDVDFTSVRQGGSNLAAALRVGCQALEGKEGDAAAMIVLSDGEDHKDLARSVLEDPLSTTIPVHTVGYGTALGEKIPIDLGDGEEFLKDSAGREVVTVLNARGLQNVAGQYGGSYVDASVADSPVVDLYRNQVAPTLARSLAARSSLGRANRYQWPLLLAVFLFCVELALSDRRQA